MPDREPGQAFIEYALIVVGVGAAAEVALQALGEKTADVFNAIGSSLGS
jgi:Flp pilus assembly pilin Flp